MRRRSKGPTNLHRWASIRPCWYRSLAVCARFLGLRDGRARSDSFLRFLSGMSEAVMLPI
ncbi:hypothetical protein EGT86_30535 [Burkholderia pseudomallei]|nr:hypothetical protein EGT86_30535 [Burkholderia pseudomallei]